MAMSGVGIAISPVVACLPLNDSARHPGKYAHAAGAQDCVPIQDRNKKPSPGQGDQETVRVQNSAQNRLCPWV